MSREEIMNDLQEPQEEDHELERFLSIMREYYKTHRFTGAIDKEAALLYLKEVLAEHGMIMHLPKEPTNQLPPLDDSLVSKRVAADAICEVCNILDKQNCSGRKENSDWCEYITALRKLPGEKSFVIEE